MTNEELLAAFFLEKSISAAVRTLEYYQDNIMRFSKWVDDALAGKNFCEITRTDYMSYILFLKKSGIRNTSLATYHRAVRTFSNWMCESGYIDVPFTKVKLPTPNPEMVLPLTSQEVLLVDRYLKTTMYPVRNYLIVHLMLDCGLRRQEVINLKWQDVHFAERYIAVICSKYNKNRMVPLPDFLADELQQLPWGCCYVFTSCTGEPLTVSAVKNLFRRLRKKTVQRLHPHLLRHTFATSYICGGGNMEFLRLYLGHSDYMVTKNYLHLSYQMHITGYDIYKLDKFFFRNFYNT